MSAKVEKPVTKKKAKVEEPAAEFPISNREVVKAYIARHLRNMRHNPLVYEAILGKPLRGARPQKITDMVIEETNKLITRLMAQCEKRGHKGIHRAKIVVATASDESDTSTDAE